MKYGKTKKAEGGKVSSADVKGKVSSADVKEATAIATDRGYQSPEDREYAAGVLKKARGSKGLAKGGKVMSRGVALRGFGKEVR